VPQTDFAGPGHWLDLDMMEVGNKIFTEVEEQTHMSLWSIIKSPLIIGAALKDRFTHISDSSLAIYKNKDVISYNQDSLGVAASFKRRWTEEEYEVWSGPLSEDRMVTALVNWANKPRVLTLDLPIVGLQRAKKVKSVWTNKTLSNVLTSFKEVVQSHGTMLLEIVSGSAVGTYDAEYFASIRGKQSVFNNIYGITTSSAYAIVVELGGNRASSSEINELTISTSSQSQRIYKHNDTLKTIKVPVSLQAGNNNTITLSYSSILTVKSITIEPPKGTYYPSTSFSLFGSATRKACSPRLCRPVGSKIGNIGPSSGAELAIVSKFDTSVRSKKYVEVDFTNNDIALATAWKTGTNTRNLTIAVNGVVTRMEMPLSGRSSEAFSPGKGWEDTGTFGVLLDGFGAGKENADVVLVSNVGGSGGIQSYGADFVGLRVFW
jgi:alpha-galactosidase